jgi:hypothetical protein
MNHEINLNALVNEHKKCFSLWTQIIILVTNVIVNYVRNIR